MLHRCRSLRVLAIALAYLLLFDSMALSALRYVPQERLRAAAQGRAALEAAVSVTTDVFVSADDPICGGRAPCFSTIQAAVDEVGPGQSVLILPGQYEEQFSVEDKNDHLGASEADRIFIGPDPSAPKGSVIVGPAGDGCWNGWSIEIERSSFVTLHGLVVRNAGRRGIKVRGQRRANRAIHVLQNVIYADGNPRCSGGITVSHHNNDTVIANNVIFGTRRDGIRIGDRGNGPQYVVSNTVVNNGHTGIYVAFAHEAFVLNNLVLSNGEGRGPRRYGIRQGRIGPRSERLHVRGNLVCGNTRGEYYRVAFDAGDYGNFSPTGAEGPGVDALPGCDDAAQVLANLAGADATMNTADDEFVLAAGSLALDVGVPLVAHLPAVDAALLRADLTRADVRPADGTGDGFADYDIGAIEAGEPGATPVPTASPTPTPTPTPTATPTPTPSPTATPTATPTPTPAPTATPTSTPTSTPTPPPTPAPTHSPSPTPTPEPTPSPTPSPSPTPINQPPEIVTSPNTGAAESEPYEYDIDAHDPEGEAVSFALATAPTGMSIDPSSGLVVWTPGAGDEGRHDVVATASDPAGLSTFQSFIVDVTSLPEPPFAVDDAYEARIGQTLSIAANGLLGNDSDPNGDPLTAIKQSDPSHGTLSLAADGSFTYTPDLPNHSGMFQSVQAVDTNFSTALPSPLWSAISSFPNYPAYNTTDDNLSTAWRAYNVVGEAFYELEFHDDITAKELQMFGLRSPANGSDFLSGTFELFDESGSLLWNSGVLALPEPERDLVVPVPDIPGVRRVRFSSSDYEGDDPGFSELHVIGDGEIYESNIVIERYITGPRSGEYLTGTTLAIGDLDGAGGMDIVQGTNTTGIANARWTAWDALTGESLFQIPAFPLNTGLPDVPQFFSVASDSGTIADIDGDGRNELLIPGASANSTLHERIAAFEHDGTLKWVSEPINLVGGAGAGVRNTSAVPVDLDGDGDVEIVVGYFSNKITVFDHEGHVVFHAVGEGYTRWWTNGPPQAVVVVDIDLDGAPEIIYGDDVYSADGTVEWSMNNSGPLFTAVANLDDDPYGELVLVNRWGKGWAFEHDGAEKWEVDNLSNGPVAIADVDGDGEPEIVGAGSLGVRVWSRDGELEWTSPVGRTSSGDGVTAFDFDGDGVMEIVYNDADDLRFYDGATGRLLAKEPATLSGCSARPAQYQPLVADVDLDGQAEVIATHCIFFTPELGTRIFGPASGSWAQTRSQWNQVAYWITNVEEGGGIPSPEPINWLTSGLNNYRVNVPLPEERTGQTDSFTYVANDGSADSNVATVFLETAPLDFPPAILSQPDPGATVGFPYVYPLLAFDPDVGDVLTHALSSAPPGMTIEPTTGRITWTPASGDIGAHAVGVIVTDTQGLSDFQSYTLTVNLPVTVPDVVGDLQAAAQAAISGVGLVPGAITLVQDPSLPVGTVRSQSPLAGSVAEVGALVALEVSTGPAPTQIDDDLDGFTEEEGDCNDANDGIFPGAPDAVGNGVDENCDGADGELVLSEIVVDPDTKTILTGEKVQYAATGILDDGSALPLTHLASWSSTTGSASIEDDGEATALVVGPTEIQAQYLGVTGAAALTVVPRAVGDLVAPVAEIDSPMLDEQVVEPIDIVGTATDANFLRYEVSLSLAGETESVLLQASDTQVASGVLGVLDPTLLINDLYTLRLDVYDTAGNVSTAEVVVQIDGNRKIGPFRLTFTDLEVPLSGIPITIERTYDSRDKSTGDFGVGWGLGVRTLRLRTNRELRTGWQMVQTSFFRTILPTDLHKVSLTLQDGRVEEFDLVLSRTQAVGVGWDSFVRFHARPGTTGALELDEDNLVAILGFGISGEEIELRKADLSGPFVPTRFRYTALDGTEIVIVRGSGVESVREPNGNTLTFAPDGISHSNGTSIAFSRDDAGRITRIDDPAGHSQTYEYDALGDLRAHTDREGHRTEMRYDHAHNLVELEDRLGRPLVRNEYDDEGRLIASTDARGNRYEVTHDQGQSLEVIDNPDGTQKILEYDAAGNVVREVDETGAETLRTFDADGNLLTETSALGGTTTFTYDQNHRQLTRSDPFGNVVTYTRNDRGALTSKRDPNGRITTYTYDARGNLTRILRPDGTARRFVHDSSGNVVRSEQPDGSAMTFEYDAAGNRTRVIDPLGNETSMTYGANGQRLTTTRTVSTPAGPRVDTVASTFDRNGIRTAVTDALGNVRLSELDSNGAPVATIDPEGRRTERDYGPDGEVNEVRYPDGLVTEITRGTQGRLESLTDRAGLARHYEYDGPGRVTDLVLPDDTPGDLSNNPRVKRSYDAAGNLTKLELPGGRSIDLEYDQAGRRTRATDPSGIHIDFTYDGHGREKTRTDPLGRTIAFEYDFLGRRTEALLPDGALLEFGYDAAGNLSSSTDGDGKATRYEYDALGRVTAVIDPNGSRTEYGYDEAGNRIFDRDALGRVTRHEYDANGRLIAEVRPDGSRAENTYDRVGNLVAIRDFDGASTTLEYGARDEVTRVVPAGGPARQHTHSPSGRIATTTDARGLTQYTYDARDRLVSRADPDGTTIAYTYDTDGFVESVTTPSGATAYEYDPAGRVSKVTDPDGGVTTYTYDAVGNRSGATFPNDVTESRTYDDRDRLELLELRDPSGTLLDSYAYTYDARDNVLSVVEHAGRSVAYAYDDASRLLSEVISDPPAVDRTIGYTYDAVGNRLSRDDSVEGTRTYEYDVNDRLTRATLNGVATDYAWDVRGNLASAVSPGRSETYTWDGENRLVMASIDEGGSTDVIEYGYDAVGLRVSKTVNGLETRFLVDHNRPIPQVLEEYDPAGGSRVAYVYGDGLVSRADASARTFPLHDGHAGVRLLVDAAGSPLNTYEYDAYGRTLAQTGGAPNAYRYRGEAFESELGQYYLRARYLDPDLGRFTSVDPIRSDLLNPSRLHRYNYAGNNPLRFLDPSGRGFFALPSLKGLLVTFAITTVIAVGLALPILNLPATVRLAVFVPTLLVGGEGTTTSAAAALHGNPEATAELVEIARLLNDWWAAEGHKLDSIFSAGGAATACSAYYNDQPVGPAVSRIACGQHPPSFVRYFNAHTQVELSHFRWRVFNQGRLTHTFLIAEWNDSANDRTVQINLDTWLHGPQATTQPVILMGAEDVTHQFL